MVNDMVNLVVFMDVTDLMESVQVKVSNDDGFCFLTILFRSSRKGDDDEESWLFDSLGRVSGVWRVVGEKSGSRN